MASILEIGSFHEILLPAENKEQSIAFYESLGFEIINETAWGLTQLKRSAEERISLLPAEWWKKVTLGYVVPDLESLKKLRDKFLENNIIIEDDVDSIPPRLAFFDPSGNEFQVIAAEE